jgi:hypothetical protein
MESYSRKQKFSESPPTEFKIMTLLHTLNFEKNPLTSNLHFSKFFEIEIKKTEGIILNFLAANTYEVFFKFAFPKGVQNYYL